MHTRAGEGGDGTCNSWGCTVNFGSWPKTRHGQLTTDLFGPGGWTTAGQLKAETTRGIDTDHPFQVEASVSERGALSLILRQGSGGFVPFFNETSASNPSTGMCGESGCGTRDPPAAEPTGLDADDETLDVTNRVRA